MNQSGTDQTRRKNSQWEPFLFSELSELSPADTINKHPIAKELIDL